jgi:hypothetical protein
MRPAKAINILFSKGDSGSLEGDLRYNQSITSYPQQTYCSYLVHLALMSLTELAGNRQFSGSLHSLIVTGNMSYPTFKTHLRMGILTK